MNHLTLGTGKATKVLAVTATTEARTITTCDHDAATAIARALQAVFARIESALYPVAVEASGHPVQARRHLLSVYDNAGAAPAADPAPAWSKAHELVNALATATTGQPAAVVAAVRTELAAHLAHLDGVLVPARVTSTAYRSGVCDIVISAALARMSEGWWKYLDAQHTASDDPTYPVGEPTLELTSDLEDIARELWYAETADYSYAATDIAELTLDTEHDQVYPIIPARLFHAWVAQHRGTPSPGDRT